MTDLVALPHEITRVHVTKVTHTESCPAPLIFPFVCTVVNYTPSLHYQQFTVKPSIVSNARNTRTTVAYATLFLPSFVKGSVCDETIHPLSLLHDAFSEPCSKGKIAIFLSFPVVPVVKVPSTPQVQPSPWLGGKWAVSGVYSADGFRSPQV